MCNNSFTRAFLIGVTGNMTFYFKLSYTMDSGLEIVLICAVSRRRFSVTWDSVLKHTLLLMQSKLKPLFVRKSDSFVRTHTCRSWGKTYIDLSNKESFKGEAGCLQPWATKTFFFVLSVDRGTKKRKWADMGVK